MRKVYFLMLLFPYLLFSCNNKDGSQSIDKGLTNSDTLSIPQKMWEFDSLSVIQKVYIDDDSTNSGMEIDLSFKYPISVPDSINLLKIQAIFNKIFSAKESIEGTPNNVFGAMVGEYQLYAKGYAEEWEKENNKSIDFSAFEQSRSTNPKFISKSLMSIVTGDYSYLGGAHGAYYIKYDNVNLLKGILIKQADLFQSEYNDKLATLIQKKITERNSSKDEDDHIALLVRLHDVKPNDNFFFSKEGLTYVFNQYEIAPYAQGFVEIEIFYEDLLPLLNSYYKPIVEDLMKTNQ